MVEVKLIGPGTFMSACLHRVSFLCRIRCRATRPVHVQLQAFVCDEFKSVLRMKSAVSRSCSLCGRTKAYGLRDGVRDISWF